MEEILPAELAKGAILRSGEYAWEPSAFPAALSVAPLTMEFAERASEIRRHRTPKLKVPGPHYSGDGTT